MNGLDCQVKVLKEDMAAAHAREEVERNHKINKVLRSWKNLHVARAFVRVKLGSPPSPGRTSTSLALSCVSN